MIANSLDDFIIDSRQQSLLKKAADLASKFAERAEKHDREGSFPFENFQDLRNAGITALTVPKQYGGQGISLYDMLLLLDVLAQGDGSTALGLGWHLGMIMNLRDARVWDERQFRQLCENVLQHGALINSCATEPATGSPSRGGRPETTARMNTDGWELSGHKTWSTLSPILTHIIVTASIEGEEDTGEFLVPGGTPGLEIVETWNSLGMRATGSHDLLLKQVRLPKDALVRRFTSRTEQKAKDGSGWLLHIPATYLGIAAAARNFAVRFAKNYHPNSLQKPISELPGVRERIGRMETELFTARTVLYQVAERWDKHPEQRSKMQGKLAAAKYVATNSALQIVDSAMRIVGGQSLLKANPLERYYRDVRAGLHNPPMDDVTLQIMAKEALESVE
ncbi:acyl-CoA dehydrogenase family protein [Ferviditalea candida]|uniref:Acyl-CoA dehydrogenase family protein n=1 Tax=Ferviditalea candida TaxID=3108399 RepID=A0ABU5ZK62_9BACL|nr:acyl-CoA dehydrogenase family protein [Paenibacillaceae bacterium T2]